MVGVSWGRKGVLEASRKQKKACSQASHERPVSFVPLGMPPCFPAAGRGQCQLYFQSPVGREEAARRGLEQLSERKPWGEGSRSDRTGQDLDTQSGGAL